MKEISQTLYGGTLLGMALVLAIPSSIGIAQFATREPPLEKDSVAEDKLVAFFAVQVVTLTISAAAICIAIYFLVSARK